MNLVQVIFVSDVKSKSEAGKKPVKKIGKKIKKAVDRPKNMCYDIGVVAKDSKTKDLDN